MEFAKCLATPPDFAQFKNMSQENEMTKDVIQKMKKFYEINGCLNFPRLVQEGLINIERDPFTKEIKKVSSIVSLD